jgi:hypothetical protein
MFKERIENNVAEINRNGTEFSKAWTKGTEKTR